MRNDNTLNVLIYVFEDPYEMANNDNSVFDIPIQVRPEKN